MPTPKDNKKEAKEKEVDQNASMKATDAISEKPKKGETKRDYSKLAEQVKKEREVAYKFMKPKIDEWALRLKVYSNQKRDKTAIGDPLLFTIFQTVFSSLYSDQLLVSFEGREEGDKDQAASLEPLAEFDYDQMGKDELDYDWDWNTLFYGRALLVNMEFDRELMCPMPEVVDMMTWLRDPNAKSVNGDRKGRGAMRFGGREIRLYKNDMDEAGVYFNYDNLKPYAGDPHSLIDNSDQARRAAQGYDETNKATNTVLGENSEIRALEWFTYWKGEKVMVTLTEDCGRVIRFQEVDNQKKWPIDERVCYKMSHDWDGVSVPDLIEDKQRARSVIQNTALAGIKTGQNPTYLYDTNKIKQRGNLDIDFNKHIPVDGAPSGAVQVVDRQKVASEVDWILNVLNTAAQSATAAPTTRQGGAGGVETATEANYQEAGVDTRYSLTAKLWGWSEREFWRKWYQLYKRHFQSKIDEKEIRINGAMGSTWRKLTRENIIANIDPDIKIESKTVSDAKKSDELQKLRLFLKDILATDPSEANTRLALRSIGELSGMKKDQVERILPPSYDEMEAEEENEQLSKGQKVEVDVSDDDFIHMVMHNKAADTPAKAAHIRAHRRAMMLKRRNPELDLGRKRPEEQVAEANVGAPLNNAPSGVGAGTPVAPTPPLQQ